MTLLRAIIASVVILTSTSWASASIVYGTGATSELIGSRTEENGVSVNGKWTTFTISWVISLGSDGLWSYSYTMSNFGNKEISHFTLDISDDNFDPDTGEVVNPGVVTNASSNFELRLGIGNSGPMDDIFGAVKFDEGGDDPTTYTFKSNRAPVYGHFAVIDGDGSGTPLNPGSTTMAFNDGFQLAGTSTNIYDFIARPDGQFGPPPNVPEPASVLIWSALGLGGIGIAKRRRDRSKRS